jgi:four helix bundle protein
MFTFQRLDVYQAARRFLPMAYAISRRCGRGLGDLGDQLRRAALSIQLNIAEGSGQNSGNALRHYAIARGSTMECAAILDAVEDLGAMRGEDLQQARECLDRIAAMLTVMSRRRVEGKGRAE